MTLISTTKRASYANLARENQELKARVAELESKQGPISLTPEEGLLEVKDLRVGPLSVESAQVRAPALRKASRDLEKVEAWLGEGRDSLKGLADGPVVVDRLKAKIPLPFVNSILEKVAGAQMAEAGLSEISLSQGENNQLKLKGKVKKGLKVPFEVTGALATTDEGKIKFSLLSSKLMGLPMPGTLVSLATRFAGESLSKAGVEVDGQDYTIDPERIKPKNVLFEMNSLAVSDGAILVDGSAPVVKGTSNIPKIPRKKA